MSAREASAGTLSDVRQARLAELRAADSALAAAARAQGLAGALVAAMSKEVVYLHAGGAPVVQGREAVRRLLEAEPTRSQLELRWRADRAEVSADGRLGFTEGDEESTIRAPGQEAATAQGRYITVWRRTDGGRWQVAGMVHAVPMPRLEGIDGPRPRPPAGDPVLAPLLAVDADFSRLAGERGAGEAFAAFAAPDAALHAPDREPAVGPEAIRRRFAERAGTDTWRWAPVFADRAADLGFTVGESVIQGTDEQGAPRTYYGKYITVWRLQPDGSWRWVADAGNGRPASGA